MPFPFRPRVLRPCAFLAVLPLSATLPPLPPGHELVAERTWTDGTGQTHTRYRHTYRGRPVWGSVLIDHTGKRVVPPTSHLAVPPEGRESVTGGPLDLEAPARPLAEGLVDTGERVLFPVYLTLAGQGPDEQPNACLWERHLQGYRPAILAAEGETKTGPVPPRRFLVDEGTGEVLATLDSVMPAYTPAKGQARLSWYPAPVTLDVARGDDGGYVLRDPTRGRGGVWGMNQVFEGLVKARATPTWGEGEPEAPGDTATGAVTAPPGADARLATTAADLAYHLQVAWDYFFKVHGREGPDGQGTAVAIRHSSAIVDYFFWIPQRAFQMLIGSPADFLPMSHLVTVTHELAHGVTEFSAGLGTRGEPGGLNEGTSDIFGMMAETWALNGAGPTIGTRTQPWVLRSWARDPFGLSRPLVVRNFVQPGRVDPPLPPAAEAWTPGLARLVDPHEAAGPLIRAFYFLCQGAARDPRRSDHARLLPGGMAGIGLDRAARIWYQALTAHLGPASGYAEARTAALRAADDLFGEGSAEVRAVASAFAAVGVGTPAVDSKAGQPRLTAQARLHGWNLHLSAAGAGLDRVREVHFHVDNMFIGSVRHAPFAVTLDARRTFAQGRHTLTAIALRDDGEAIHAEPQEFALPYDTQQLLVNAGFEGGQAGWDGLRAAALAGESPYDPHWVRADFRVCAAGPVAFSQKVALPAGAGSARLAFWARVRGARAGDDPAAGRGALIRVRVTQATPGTEVAEPIEMVLGGTGAGPGWRPHSLDLARFAGRRVEVAFQMQVPDPCATVLELDRTSLLVSPGPLARVELDPPVLDLWPGPVRPIALRAVLRDGTGALHWSLRAAPGQGGTLTPGPHGQATYTPPAEPGHWRIRVQAAADPGVKAYLDVRVHRPFEVVPSPPAVLPPAAHWVFRPVLAPGTVVTWVRCRRGQVRLDPDTGEVHYLAPVEPGTDEVEVVAPRGRVLGRVRLRIGS